LQAYRRGLYLACASLLGALSEGAWYSLGERLRGVSGKLDDALDKDATQACKSNWRTGCGMPSKGPQQTSFLLRRPFSGSFATSVFILASRLALT